MNFPNVIVEWYDSAHVAKGWEELGSIDWEVSKRSLINVTVGALIHSDPAFVAITSSYQKSGDSRHVAGVIVIPRCSISRLDTLATSDPFLD